MASGMYLVQERRIKAKLKPGSANGRTSLDWLPPLDTLDWGNLRKMPIAATQVAPE